MPIAEALLPEYDHEMSMTRHLLTCVPEAHKDWRPHPKSYSLSDLATHLGNIPVWATFVLEQNELDLATIPSRATFESMAAVLARYDGLVSKVRSSLAATPDVALLVPWTLKKAGQPLFSMPRIGVLRSFVMNHMVHHRGQLTVYLRLLDVPLPPIYGPTADTPS